MASRTLYGKGGGWVIVTICHGHAKQKPDTLFFFFYGGTKPEDGDFDFVPLG
ncbi:MAG: hypothetical protein KJ900_10590 [Proteobacteria bacterium]|jgi:hypothetical protein|nr:hypothetical protein [Pseudomonadota bacterium]MCG2744176.1 hypothetical protein [Desulfobacteraceae bacterium]MBU4029549.1 hypothetical protein [Pseudomonadota bacterium]MBU4043325.1 hypothetical protein [Pseudomonadota bacterium]MBU4084850.1 hypothetical protein [Pseudomonadota bacterium]